MTASSRRGRSPRFTPARRAKLHRHLEELYERYHRPQYIGTDPLVVALEHSEGIDREFAGLIAAWFASGRARSIVEKSRECIARLTLDGQETLSETVKNGTPEIWLSRLGDFRYRWVDALTLAASLSALQYALEAEGGLLAAISCELKSEEPNVLLGLGRVVARYEGHAKSVLSSMSATSNQYRALCWVWANPERGAAAKRWMMWLRWFVRQDAIDPGGCSSIEPKQLVMPLDTHVFRLSRFMGLTTRRNADQRTAIQITNA